jgi:hypothetical protein
MRQPAAPLTAVVLMTLVLVALAAPAAAQTNVTGQWSVLPQTMPINPIHVGLMRTGKIVVVAGSENDPTVTTYRAAVYNPATGSIAVQTIPWDLFCNGLSWLPDGRALITGGNLQYNPFRGIRTTTIFDPATEKFIQVQDMARGRWYPSNVALPDGRTATFSGWLENGGTNNAVELYTVPNGWSPQYFAPFTPPLYPWLHLLPNGRVFMSGASRTSQIFNPATTTWQTNVATMNYGRERTYGSSVLLPLSPADGYRPRVMIMGGDNPATASAEIIDLSQATPSWRMLPPMSAPRIQMNAVILPTGKILALGGSAQNNTASTASLDADLFDPATETWSPAGRATVPRMYHSVALLLPDATVWTAGSNPQQGTYENRMEIYRPAYLFAAGGGAAARPSISAAPGVVGYNTSFQVSTPSAASIASVALIRNGADTHAFDMEQRMVSLSFTRGSGALTVTSPPNANIAPPGYYMLFLVDTSGVPSVARFVQLSPTPGNAPPNGQITNPAGDVTIRAGQSVTFAGSGSDTDGSVTGYRWIFPGGSLATSASATPGAVTFNTPGTYTASLTVTDNQGANDPSPPTRTITVQTASLTAAFTNPAEGSTVSGTVTVGMAASGASGSSNTFTLFINNTQVFSTSTSGSSASYTWNTTLVNDGAYTLRLDVRDASGATASATRSVQVNNAAAPGRLSVSFPNLIPGQTVSGTVPVQIAVSGTTGTSNRFTVSIDGVQQTVIVSNSTTVTWNWDTTTVPNGSPTISASVQDAGGNTGNGFVYVQVQNASFAVGVTQPKSGATVSGTVWTTVWVTGAAAGTKTYTATVAGQQLATVNTTSSGPVSLAWNSTAVPNGTQTLTVTVRDSAGAVGSSNVPVNVQNAGSGGLTASFTTPAAGATVSGTVGVGMAASGGTAPYTYTLTIDGAQVASSTSTAYSWNTTTYSNASHTLGLTVRDGTGATATATRSVTVQNTTGGGGGGGTLPVGITSPTTGATVSGTAWVIVWVDGAAAGSKTYTMSVAGTTVYTGDSSSRPASLPWDTTRTPNGTQTLVVSVRDSAGATGSGSVTVNVQNAGSPPPSLTAAFTAPAAGVTVSGTVGVTMSASGGTAPYTYTLTIDGAQVASSTSTTYSWNTTTYSNASHTLGLTVRDGTGATATASRSVTVQNSTGGGGGGGTLSVGITAPRTGDTVSGTAWVIVWVDGAASGSKTYTMSVAGTTVFTGASSSRPASLPWDTTLTADGARTLVVSVVDSAGATGTGSVAVNVQNGSTPPPTSLTAGFTAPAAGATVSGTVGVGMSATGGTAPYTYTLTIDGAQVTSSTSTTYSWNTTTYSNASHTLGLTVRDGSGATATASRTVTVQNSTGGGGGGTLSVGITAPRVGATVSGTTWVTIWVDGAASGSKTYTMSVGGSTVWTEATASRPATLPWVTTDGPNGAQTLVVGVSDSAGAAGSGSVAVTVSNP